MEKSQPEKTSGRTVLPDGEKIKAFRISRGWNVEELAKKVGMTPGGVSRIEKGQPCFPTNLIGFAKVFGFKDDCSPLIVGYQEPEEQPINATASDKPVEAPTGKRLKVAIKVADHLPEFVASGQAASMAKVLTELVHCKDEIHMVMLKPGCTEITFDMSEDDAKRLQEAFKDGRLESLGIISVAAEEVAGKADAPDDGAIRTQPSSVGVEQAKTQDTSPSSHILGDQPLLKRLNYGRIASCASIACSLSMLFPIYAPPFYAAGATLAFMGGMLARNGKASLLLAVIGLLLNLGGLLAWPKAVDRATQKQPQPQPDQADVSSKITFKRPVFTPANGAGAQFYKDGDRIRIIIGGKVKLEKTISDSDLMNDIVLKFSASTGSHSLAILRNGDTVYSGQVLFDAKQDVFIRKDDVEFTISHE